MCGICGIVNQSGVGDAGPALREMTGALRHRGPDDEGCFADPRAALGMRRLSIIDLEGGHQPILNEDESMVIVFNGEIYNFRELRSGLEARGHSFRTRTDTEVILHLYEDRGPACLERLRGMFAFAVYDIKNRSLFLARDRIGIKPLVYTNIGDSLLFASEIRALRKHPGFEARLHLPALARYLTHLYIPGEETIFEGVRRLPPAHHLLMTPEGTKIERYWRLPPLAVVPPGGGRKGSGEYEEEIIARLEESVKEHLVSDVPVGSFLSGGIDSSAVTGMMSRVAGEKIRTYSIGFSEQTYNELPYARAVAEKFATEHNEMMVDYPEDLAGFLPTIARCFDEPFADGSVVPTYFICREASRHLKVMLSGNGGDELFGGYAKFTAEHANRLLSIVPRPIRRAALARAERRMAESIRADDRARRIKRMLRYSLLPPEIRPIHWINGFDHDGIRELLMPDVSKNLEGADPLTPLRRHFEAYRDADTISRLLFTEFHTFLPDNNLFKDDTIGMAHSLEIRVPFLDHRLVEAAFAIPSSLKVRGFTTKHILKKALATLLPGEILHRPKQGFIAPIGAWIKNELHPLARDLFFTNDSQISSFLNKKALDNTLSEHMTNRVDHSHRLWALLFLLVWEKEEL